MKVIIIFLLATRCLGLSPEFSRRSIMSKFVYSPIITNFDDKESNEITKDEEPKQYYLNEELIDNKRSHNIIQQNNNNIYFYSPVTQESCFELTKRLLDLDSTSQTFNLQYGTHAPIINLHIQSEGGSLLLLSGEGDERSGSLVVATKNSAGRSGRLDIFTGK